MENFKSVLFLVIFLAIIAIVGYWAFFTLEPGSLHAERQKQEQLKKENMELKVEIEELTKELRALSYEVETPAEPVIENKEPATPSPASTSTTYKNQTLINELERLITDNIVMREKSRGTRVGTVQKFLNVYNGTSKTIDNDFGPGMKTDVIKLQKALGVTADGEVGPGTFRKMIDWLKKQG